MIRSALCFCLLICSLAFPDESFQIDQILEVHTNAGFNQSSSVVVIKNDLSNFINSEDNISNTTIYEIGSISKVFTAIILASLQIEGILKLDDPIKLYIPELASSESGELTLLELSTHTSGMPRLPTNMPFSNPLNPYFDYSEKLLLEFLQNYKVGTHPTPFSWSNYSNLGVGLLGYTLTRATNLSYQELLSKYITSPLNMNDTVISLNLEQLTRFVTPLDDLLETVLPWDLNVLVGAGGIKSTTNDLEKFIRANLNPEQTKIASALLLTQKISHFSETGSHIGLGWIISKSDNHHMIQHDGGTGGFRSHIAFDLKNKTGLVWLTNSANSLKCLDQLVFLDDDSCVPNFGHIVELSKLQSYVGLYKNTETNLVFNIYLKNNRLAYELVGQDKGALSAINDFQFHIQNIAFIEFIVELSGEVNAFSFSQGEWIGRFIRIN